MVPTFILTRTFAVSVLFIGAFAPASAVPVLSSGIGFERRNCRVAGCLFADPISDGIYSSVSTATAAAETSTAVKPIVEVIEFISPAVNEVNTYNDALSATEGQAAGYNEEVEGEPVELEIRSLEVISDTSHALTARDTDNCRPTGCL